jgi:hypothetical protein
MFVIATLFVHQLSKTMTDFSGVINMVFATAVWLPAATVKDPPGMPLSYVAIVACAGPFMATSQC